ncbi:hypothetical protein Brsp06_03716 [Brucella sp. NBRC 13694]|jgi:hypothetical protein|nr:hypothetical protein [Brucella anthropi]NIH74863.1 hypothetical protein [Ochrobactrum sp. P20RRXII]
MWLFVLHCRTHSAIWSNQLQFSKLKQTARSSFDNGAVFSYSKCWLVAHSFGKLSV